MIDRLILAGVIIFMAAIIAGFLFWIFKIGKR